MKKSPDAFRTISEVADILDVPQHVLRFWEGKFPDIKPMKRSGGRRYYRPDDIALLRGVRALLYAQGHTIKAVQKILAEEGADFVIDAGRAPVSDTDDEHAAPVAEADELDADSDGADAGEDEIAEDHDDDDEDDESAGDDEVAADPTAVVAAREVEPEPERLAPRSRARRRAAAAPEAATGLLDAQRARLEAALQELLALRDALAAAKAKSQAA